MNINKTTKYLSFVETPIGKLGIVVDDDYIIKITLPNEEGEFLEFYKKETNEIKTAKAELIEYFLGYRKNFSFKFKQEGTNFRIKVWNELLNIPYGTTCSYKDIAKLIGSPLAYRAVGQANNKNNLPIVVPCHRVIGYNNSYVGYAGGIKIKEYLINLEKHNI
ncbi:MAG: methylated-DNA--[protein]-cysteine S-methyltransferase [Filifactoraceae bacterium]